MSQSGVRWLLLATAIGALPSLHASALEESLETAPIRPEGGSYVPPPFAAIAVDPHAAICSDRRYDLGGAVPLTDIPPPNNVVVDAIFQPRPFRGKLRLPKGLVD